MSTDRTEMASTKRSLKSYRDLDIYKMAYELAVKVHAMSLLLPNYERYEQGSQLRRASKSIAACIAEGYGRKQYKAEFVKFLIYAHASCDETVVHLNFLVDTHDLDPVPVKQLIRSYEELGSRIHNFIKYVDKEWRKQETVSE